MLRTQWLRLRLWLSGRRVRKIHKGRLMRHAFIHASTKVQQLTVFEKYADVFRRLGYPDFQVDFHSLFPEGGAPLDTTLPHFDLTARPEPNWVGIAPFAAHEGKIYPLPLMEQVVSQLSARGDVRVFLFGAGPKEGAILQRWSQRYPHVESMVGQLKDMGEELALISHCKVMVSMDSGNMHLASLAAVPVVSIWGATHPLGGFLGYGQSLDNVLQADLPCRPCSVYGQKACRFGNYQCLTSIQPETVVKKIASFLTTD